MIFHREEQAMKKLTATAILVAAILISMVSITAPAAAASRTWVAGDGSDANPCTRTMPCATFGQALSVTDAFGEINCLNGGSFGILIITKSVTISCESGTAGILANADGIVVNVAATDTVYLKGLDIEGLGPSSVTQFGIAFGVAGTLHVEKCRI